MLTTLYKDGRSIHAAPEQVPFLEKDGWSSTKPALQAQAGKGAPAKPAQNASTTPTSGNKAAAKSEPAPSSASKEK